MFVFGGRALRSASRLLPGGRLHASLSSAASSASASFSPRLAQVPRTLSPPPPKVHPKVRLRMRALLSRAAALRSFLGGLHGDTPMGAGDNLPMGAGDNLPMGAGGDLPMGSEGPKHPPLSSAVLAPAPGTPGAAPIDRASAGEQLGIIERAVPLVRGLAALEDELASLVEVIETDPELAEMACEEWGDVAERAGAAVPGCVEAVVEAHFALKEAEDAAVARAAAGGGGKKGGAERGAFFSVGDGGAVGAVLELRPGAGGHEAGLFAEELFLMYQRVAQDEGWRFEVVEESALDGGGLRCGSAILTGAGVFHKLRWETGVHRVQRVPETEKSGRVHTSTAVVSVLPEAGEADVVIDKADLRIDTYRSSGAGGQHVNTTDSAVRITHIPTNTVVTCQDERSQHKNKAKAMAVLRSRVLHSIEEQLHAERTKAKADQVGTGSRSERIRTYNELQDRVTDHRCGVSLHGMDALLTVGEGLEEITRALEDREKELRLQALIDDETIVEQQEEQG